MVRLAVALATVGLAVSTLLPSGSGAARASEAQIGVVGFMPFDGRPEEPGLLIDDVRHRGFAFDLNASPIEMLVYDLQRLRLEKRVPLPFGTNNNLRPYAVADPAHHRIFWTLAPTENPDVSCRNSPVGVFDTKALSWTVRHLPCMGGPGQGFVINGLSYHEPSDKLHVVGYPSAWLAVSRHANLATTREPTHYLQVDPDTFTVDWQVDASAECDWHRAGSAPATVARAGNRLVGFCLQGGLNQNSGGGRGAALSLLLNPDGTPVVQDGKPVVKLAPTFTDSGVRTIVDQATGRLLIIARPLPFGPAVWVFDTAAGWFNGVVPTGFDPNTLEGYDYGFDARTGRLYLHSSRGYVLIDARHTPLPGGVSYAVDTEPNPRPGSVEQMVVDAGLHRVFRKDVVRKGWIVVEDRVPYAPDEDPPDPDRGTADIPEVPGVTDRTYSGHGTAFGAHLLHVGGIPSALQSNAARADCALRRVRAESACLFPTLVAPGNREYFLTQATMSAGNSSGVSAFATAGRAAPRDYATDADARSLGRCYADRLQQVVDPARALVDQLCPKLAPQVDQAAAGPLHGFGFGALATGTAPHDRPEDDVPVPSSACTDAGGSPTTTAGETRPSPMVGWSQVACDATTVVVAADARTSAASYPTAELPSVTVGRTTSTLGARLDPQRGMVTIAEASAEDVRIGGVVTIGRVHTRAEGGARGRPGTAAAKFTREITGVRTPDFSCLAVCDPDLVVQAVNRAFPGIVTARAYPAHTVASRGGYTGLVSKDPGMVASDVALNDNDEVTANGLDLIFVRDAASDTTGLDGQKSAARNRLVLGLAGVQAESHYGVFPLPRRSDLDAVEADGASIAAGTGSGITSAFGALQDTPFRAVAAAGAARAAGNARYRFPTLAEAWRIVVNNPGQAALLAAFLALFAWPIYLSSRRRAVASGMRGG